MPRPLVLLIILVSKMKTGMEYGRTDTDRGKQMYWEKNLS
jgi:hypothetical protein